MMVIMIVITEISDDWITCLMVLTFDSFLKRVVKVLDLIALLLVAMMS